LVAGGLVKRTEQIALKSVGANACSVSGTLQTTDLTVWQAHLSSRFTRQCRSLFKLEELANAASSSRDRNRKLESGPRKEAE
jgi:hypothetical protein